MERWGDEMQERIKAGASPDRGYLDRLTAIIDDTIGSIRATTGRCGRVHSTCWPVIGHVPTHVMLRTGIHQARTGNVAIPDAVPTRTPSTPTRSARSASLLPPIIGLVVQWLIDPDTAPRGEDIAEALVHDRSQGRPVTAGNLQLVIMVHLGST